jgi:hypothetical protein
MGLVGPAMQITLFEIGFQCCYPDLRVSHPAFLRPPLASGCLKPASFNMMMACIVNAERTIGRVATRRPTLDHNMVYVAGRNLELHPSYCHELGGCAKV